MMPIEPTDTGFRRAANGDLLPAAPGNDAPPAEPGDAHGRASRPGLQHRAYAPPSIGQALPTWIAVTTMRGSVMACKFGLAIFISRCLDLASLGIYGLIVGAAAVGPVVICVGLSNVLMREAVTMTPGQLTDGLRHYWTLLATAYAVLLLPALLYALAPNGSWLWTAVVVIMMFEHLGSDVFQLLSNLERPLLANVTAFLRGAAWILVYVPLAAWNPHLRSLPVLVAFWIAGAALALLLFACAARTWPWKSAFALPFRPAWITTSIRRSLVIYASDISFVAGQYLDRYLVTLFLGLEFAGVYVLYWTVGNSVVTFITMAVLQQQRPILIKAHRHGGAAAHQRLTARFMRATVTLSLALALVLGSVFHAAVPLLGQPLAAAHMAAFWLIMAGMIARCLADLGAMALFAARRDRLMTLTNVAAVGGLVFAEAALLPLAGLYGAGAAILSTFVAITLWRHWLLFGGSQISADRGQTISERPETQPVATVPRAMDQRIPERAWMAIAALRTGSERRTPTTRRADGKAAR